jgi:hypothetical protein
MVMMSGLPLFILGPDFMPMSTTTLRVFEPRYKQMMDDCILNDLPFGYISIDPKKDDLGGWSQPSKYGVIANIEQYEESGSNLIISVTAGSRFLVNEVIQPVLENNIVGEHFPTVDELMLRAEQRGWEGKLYISCEAEELLPIIHNHDSEDFGAFIDFLFPISNLIIASCMYRGQQLDFLDSGISYSPVEEEVFLWKVATGLSHSVIVQQQMLASNTTTELMQVLIEAATDLLSIISSEEQ